MTRQFSLIAVIGLALLRSVVLAAQNSDQTPSPAVMQAVETVFPQELRYTKPPYAGAETDPNYIKTCAAIFSRNADGTPNLIAAAYNGEGAEIAMLAYSQDKGDIISSITNQQFALEDGECELEIVGLADPEHPDSPLAKTIDATFRGGPDWFFIWDGQKFQSITPLQAEMSGWYGKFVPDSLMYSARIVDIDHSGPMQIVADEVAPDRGPWPDDGVSSTGIRRCGTSLPASGFSSSDRFSRSRTCLRTSR